MKRLTHEVQKKTVGLIVDRIMSEKIWKTGKVIETLVLLLWKTSFGDLF